MLTLIATNSTSLQQNQQRTSNSNHTNLKKTKAQIIKPKQPRQQSLLHFRNSKWASLSSALQNTRVTQKYKYSILSASPPFTLKVLNTDYENARPTAQSGQYIQIKRAFRIITEKALIHQLSSLSIDRRHSLNTTDYKTPHQKLPRTPGASKQVRLPSMISTLSLSLPANLEYCSPSSSASN